ncbi:MAG: hypothetical protein WBM76_14375 [Woeseiaceae bacterium]
MNIDLINTQNNAGMATSVIAGAAVTLLTVTTATSAWVAYAAGVATTVGVRVMTNLDDFAFSAGDTVTYTLAAWMQVSR